MAYGQFSGWRRSLVAASPHSGFQPTLTNAAPPMNARNREVTETLLFSYLLDDQRI